MRGAAPFSLVERRSSSRPVFAGRFLPNLHENAGPTLPKPAASGAPGQLQERPMRPQWPEKKPKRLGDPRFPLTPGFHGFENRPTLLPSQDLQFFVRSNSEGEFDRFQERSVGDVVAVGETPGHRERVASLRQRRQLPIAFDVEPRNTRQVPKIPAMEFQFRRHQLVGWKQIVEIPQIERGRGGHDHDAMPQCMVHPDAVYDFRQAALGKEFPTELPDQIRTGVRRFAVRRGHIGAFQPDGRLAQEPKRH